MRWQTAYAAASDLPSSPGGVAINQAKSRPAMKITKSTFRAVEGFLFWTSFAGISVIIKDQSPNIFFNSDRVLAAVRSKLSGVREA